LRSRSSSYEARYGRDLCNESPFPTKETILPENCLRPVIKNEMFLFYFGEGAGA